MITKEKEEVLKQILLKNKNIIKINDIQKNKLFSLLNNLPNKIIFNTIIFSRILEIPNKVGLEILKTLVKANIFRLVFILKDEDPALSNNKKTEYIVLEEIEKINILFKTDKYLNYDFNKLVIAYQYNNENSFLSDNYNSCFFKISSSSFFSDNEEQIRQLFILSIDKYISQIKKENIINKTYSYYLNLEDLYIYLKTNKNIEKILESTNFYLSIFQIYYILCAYFASKLKIYKYTFYLERNVPSIQTERIFNNNFSLDLLLNMAKTNSFLFIEFI